MLTAISHRSTLILWIDRVLCIRMPAMALRTVRRSGMDAIKWEIDYVVKVVPGKTLLETPEDFLYWRSENRNHVHAQEFVSETLAGISSSLFEEAGAGASADGRGINVRVGSSNRLN